MNDEGRESIQPPPHGLRFLKARIVPPSQSFPGTVRLRCPSQSIGKRRAFPVALYFTSPHDGPSHFAEKLVSTVIECPPPLEVICPEPLTFSGLSTSIRMIPLVFTSPNSQIIFTSAFVLVEAVIVCLHSFALLKGCSASFSLVSQSLLV